MDKRPTAGGIYARMSSDPTGEALGVRRQIADCTVLAERLGWPVAQVYVDDDVSAYTNVVRPAYMQLLSDLADGVVDAVLVYHLDRLTRRPKELEEFVEVCDRARVVHVATVEGNTNLGSGDGLMVARVMAAVAAHESATKSRRLRRKMEEMAREGRSHGPYRAFGYESGNLVVRPEEARVIRGWAAAYLAGTSLRSLAQEANSDGLPTVRGAKVWHETVIRRILGSARISGRREHHGQIVAAAVWPAIISVTRSDRLRALLVEADKDRRRTPGRYLLTGMIACAGCSRILRAKTQHGVRIYGCRREPSIGCGRTHVFAEPLERFVIDAVLARLDDPALTAWHSIDPGQAKTAETAAAVQAHLDELADLYAAGQITATEWTRARQPIEARLQRALRHHHQQRHAGVLGSILGQGTQLATDWDHLHMSRQRAILSAVLDHVTLGTGKRSEPVEDRTQLQWRELPT
jgi:site-specific DNA recombinase